MNFQFLSGICLNSKYFEYSETHNLSFKNFESEAVNNYLYPLMSASFRYFLALILHNTRLPN